jgi:hypothetical protein
MNKARSNSNLETVDFEPSAKMGMVSLVGYSGSVPGMLVVLLSAFNWMHGAIPGWVLIGSVLLCICWVMGFFTYLALDVYKTLKALGGELGTMEQGKAVRELAGGDHSRWAFEIVRSAYIHARKAYNARIKNKSCVGNF